MSGAEDLFFPVAGVVGIGGIGGFVVGYALKKLVKVVILLLGLGFLLLEYLAYKGVITVNFSALQDWASEIWVPTSGFFIYLTQFSAHLPFGASFALGLYIGLKKG